MDTGTKLHELHACLENWLKLSPLADVTHRILRFDGTILVAYCGRTVQYKEASKTVLGTRHCEVCEQLHRQRVKDRERRLYANDR